MPGARRSRPYDVSLHPGDLLAQYLDETGNGTGTVNWIGDYSAGTGTPSEAIIVVPANAEYHVTELTVFIEDSTMQAGNYGALAALTNGIVIEVHDAEDNIVWDVTAGFPVNTNSEYKQTAEKIARDDPGAGNVTLAAHYEFEHQHGTDLLLQPGWSIHVHLTDNLTGLVAHTFQARGHIERLG